MISMLKIVAYFVIGLGVGLLWRVLNDRVEWFSDMHGITFLNVIFWPCTLFIMVVIGLLALWCVIYEYSVKPLSDKLDRFYSKIMNRK